MRRIIYDVPRWSIYLHRAARGLANVDVADPRERRLEDEVFSRIYEDNSDLLPDPDRDPVMRSWAEQLHAGCDQLPDWARLAAECRGDPDAAATAVETIMDELAPRMNELAASEKGPELRRALRSSCARAADAVEELRDAAEGLEHVAIGRAPGTGTASGAAGPASSARALAQRLKGDARLRKIAKLAGRFRRVAAQKRRSKVRHGADEIADIELGAEIGRLLPAELGKLVQPRLRLVLIRDLLEYQAMQYALRGTETLGRGPLVLCLDRSGSMEGEADLWSSAVALALLSEAQRGHRPFALLAFDADIKYEAVVEPGQALPEAGVFIGCAGGTNIDRVLRRALDLIERHSASVLRKADVVLVSDGASDIDRAHEVRERATALGVSILGVGIAVEESALAPWCDEVQVVNDLDHLDDRTADHLFTR